MNVILGMGPLGMAVAKELLGRGEAVTMVSRNGAAPLPRGARFAKADLLDSEQAVEAMKGARKVFQCAQPPYSKWTDLFMRMQDHVVAGAIAHRAKLIVAENLYMYGQVDGPMSENSAYVATTRKGMLRSAMAEKLLKHYREGVLQVAIGRGSDFFGPFVLASAVGERFFRPILKGKPCSVLGNPDKKHTYTYIGDFGRALATLGDHDDAFGQAWHVPSAEAVTTRQFAETACRIAGRPPAVRAMGRTMLRIGGLFLPDARENVEMFYQFEYDFVADSGKYEQRFRQRATPLETSIAETLSWYEENRA